ncbi:ankyrin repeat domain-containing protein [Xanthomonas cerealis pv. cerealis]|uniref:Ankyrin repeat domain-containing protein n=2 Tax=Xanthomonas translucens group TaxID=3390202 RepID=A0A514EJC3_9XANT|nr:ankyrin repeat domain-containing protein [Xanthomonas translucens pv. cerealis]
MKRENPAAYFDGPYLQAAQAIEDNDMARLQILVRNGVVVDTPGRKQMTLLWYSMQRENFDAITTLIRLGSDPDKQVAQGLGTALEVALTHKDPRYLDAMLEGGLSPNLQSEDGTTLLQRATLGPNAIERIKLLVMRGADVNLRDKIGGTALADAIDVRKPEIALYLVEQGADVNATMTNGVSIAWGLQFILQRLQPGAASGEVTDITLDAKGQPVPRDTTPPSVSETDQANNKLRADFERLRDLMIAKGAQFPAEPPAKVRERMKAQGLEVAE